MWSLGITLVELALGRFPFSADSNSDDDDDPDSNDALAVIDRYADGLGDSMLDLADDTLSPVRPAEKGESLDQAEKRRALRRDKLRLDSGGDGVNGARRDASDGSTAGPRPPRRQTKSSMGASHQMSILELLQYIVNEPAPRLAEPFSPQCIAFVDACLKKEPVGWNTRKQGPIPREMARSTPKELLVRDGPCLIGLNH